MESKCPKCQQKAMTENGCLACGFTDSDNTITSNLKWTKEKPKDEGWYWKRDYYGVDIVYVRWYCDKLCIMNWGIPDDTEWAGPIPIPEEK